MNKIIYFIINIIAFLIAILLIKFGQGFIKLFGIIGIIYIAIEFFTDKYKKYIN
jgi:hypothetical protein